MIERGGFPAQFLMAGGAIVRSHPGEKLTAVNIVMAFRAAMRRGLEIDMLETCLEVSTLVALLAGNGAVRPHKRK